MNRAQSERLYSATSRPRSWWPRSRKWSKRPNWQAHPLMKIKRQRITIVPLNLNCRFRLIYDALPLSQKTQTIQSLKVWKCKSSSTFTRLYRIRWVSLLRKIAFIGRRYTTALVPLVWPSLQILESFTRSESRISISWVAAQQPCTFTTFRTRSRHYN